jgi:hypothetical protein
LGSKRQEQPAVGERGRVELVYLDGAGAHYRITSAAIRHDVSLAKVVQDALEAAVADLGGYAAIVPGRPEKSALIQRITSADDDERMPPKATGKKLTGREISLLTEWVRQGAEYSRHWSYVMPTRPPLPLIKQKDWPRNEIDYFLLAARRRRRQPWRSRYLTLPSFTTVAIPFHH